MTVTKIRQATRKDQVLSQVLRFTLSGWPSVIDAKSTLQPYSSRRQELTVEEGCLLWGIRVVVPEKLRKQLLEELHRDHPGISRMKLVARGYMWWPGLDREIEKLAQSCETCLAVKHKPPIAPLHPWRWPPHPWQRVHLDFAGPFQGSMFLVCVDAHSKWPEAHIMSSTTTTKTLEVLRQIFAAHGLPEQIVTDNGPQFVSEDFATFTKANGIKHIRTAPYHPASNGLAERFVQSMKQSLKATLNSGHSLSYRLSNYLLSYRSTPHATTGVAPSKLFLHRNLRTRLDLLRPDTERRVMEKQGLQKDHRDQHCRDRSWYVGESVMVRNLRPGLDWIRGVVVERLGPVTYLVDVGQNRIWKRHTDQLKSIGEKPPSMAEDLSDSSVPAPSIDAPRMPESAPSSSEPAEVIIPTSEDPPPAPVTESASEELPTTEPSSVTPPNENDSNDDDSPPELRRYPSRSHQRPDWYHTQQWS